MKKIICVVINKTVIKKGILFCNTIIITKKVPKNRYNNLYNCNNNIKMFKARKAKKNKINLYKVILKINICH